MCTPLSRRDVTSDSGARAWGYRGRYQGTSESDWSSESKVTDSVTPLQFDVFHAPMSLCTPRHSNPPHQRARQQRGPRSRREALRLIPTGTMIAKSFQSRELRGQVYDFYGRHWRVCYEHNWWEESSRREMEEFVVRGREKKRHREKCITAVELDCSQLWTSHSLHIG